MLRTAQSLPPTGLLTLGFDAGRFLPTPASLLPGLLAATRTGLPPAGNDELVTKGSAQHPAKAINGLNDRYEALGQF
jgi:hypothetical protein